MCIVSCFNKSMTAFIFHLTGQGISSVNEALCLRSDFGRAKCFVIALRKSLLQCSYAVSSNSTETEGRTKNTNYLLSKCNVELLYFPPHSLTMLAYQLELK